MVSYIPVIDVISKGKLRRIELKTESTLKLAALARARYIATRINQERHFFSKK